MKKNRNFIRNKIGEKIRYYRNFRGVTLKKLAEELNITSQQLQKYEKGMNRITTERLEEISLILDIPVSYFFNDLKLPKNSHNDTEIRKLIFNFKKISSRKIRKLLIENSAIFAEEFSLKQ